MAKEIDFFIGSGCSLASLKMGVSQINDAILHWENLSTGDTAFDRYQLTMTNPFQDGNVRKQTLELIDFVKNECDGNLQSRGKTSTYEDWYQVLWQLKSEFFGYSLHPSDPAVFRYGVFIAQQMGLFSRTDWPMRLATEANFAKKFIEYVVIQELNKNYTVGYEIISDLADIGYKSNIFSLNHDLLIEECLDGKGVPFIDGFNSDDDGGLFDADLFLTDAPVKLYKLHGGIDWTWQLRRNDDVSQGITKRPKSCLNGKITMESVLGPLHHQPDESFLSGTGKASRYANRAFGDLICLFKNRLRSTNRLVISGYGWSDKEMNIMLWDWMSKEGNKAYMYYDDLERSIAESRIEKWGIYQDFEAKGRLIRVGKYLEKANTAEICSLA